MLLMTRPTPAERRIASGQWLREERERRKLGGNDVARAIGVTKGMVSAYETGRSHMPQERVPALAALFGLGLVETRRALGMYVPDDALDDAPPPDVQAAIRADRRLLPEARRHLLDQYDLLLRLQREPDPDEAAYEDAQALREADASPQVTPTPSSPRGLRDRGADRRKSGLG